jgi:hypothetical protein
VDLNRCSAKTLTHETHETLLTQEGKMGVSKKADVGCWGAMLSFRRRLRYTYETVHCCEKQWLYLVRGGNRSLDRHVTEYSSCSTDLEVWCTPEHSLHLWRVHQVILQITSNRHTATPSSHVPRCCQQHWWSL